MHIQMHVYRVYIFVFMCLLACCVFLCFIFFGVCFFFFRNFIAGVRRTVVPFVCFLFYVIICLIIFVCIMIFFFSSHNAIMHCTALRQCEPKKLACILFSSISFHFWKGKKLINSSLLSISFVHYLFLSVFLGQIYTRQKKNRFYPTAYCTHK